MTIQESFDTYHRENPHVFTAFVRYAREAKKRGFDKFGAKAIMERIRWHFNIETVGDVFLINNNYTALYARKAMDECPDLKGLFHLRERIQK